MFVTTWIHNVILLIVFILTHVSSEVLNSNESCAILYEKGAEAYLENNFKGCVDYFEKAVEKYRVYAKTLQNCRIECTKKASEERPLYDDDIDDLHFFEKIIKTTLCIIKCRKEHKGIFGAYNINKETEKLFETSKPYEYLHICYFQTENYQKAASSAFTYLVTHPDDKPMLASLKHYTNFPGVYENDIINFEAKEYVYLYVHGADAYNRKDWEKVVQNMEESLISYMQAEEECRALCEGPFDQGWYPDFVPSIANHFTYCLRCKRKCKDKLSSLNGEKYNDLVASHYHYLQYAYFKLGKLKAACQSVASYLLFYPDDEDMKSNFEYYQNLPEVKDEFFTPREEAILYTKRETYESKLLDFIYKNFNFGKTIFPGKEEKILKIEVFKNATQLKGTQRYVADNFLTSRQCKSLIYIANLFATLGDGYTGNKAPHTAKEIFGGISFSRITFLVNFGLIDIEYLNLIIKVTEDAKTHVENYFNVSNLHFSYTHLVCRSATPGSQENRTDLSHSVHADNCNLHLNGSCEKAYPSYTSRDYSTIIYLNDDFVGGEFIFTSDYYGKAIQSSVNPKCGRMVAFSSGVENIHAVKAVQKGTRCAVALWFTFNPNETENRQYAYELIKDGT